MPKLLIDFANTPSLHDAEIVLQDIDPAPLPRMAEFVEHLADVRGIGMTATGTTDQRQALEGADYVVVCISTGGFDSHAPRPRDPGAVRHEAGGRRHRRARAGSSAPCATSRCSSSIARDMEELCPDAWMLNITNPMTTICRAVTRETSVKTVGLCHEIAGAQFTLVQLLDVDFREIDVEVAGVNHLPFITACVDGRDGSTDCATRDAALPRAVPRPPARAEPDRKARPASASTG